MNKKINIVYIIDYFHRTGGTERHLAELVQSLARDRFACSVVVFDMGTSALLQAMRHSGVRVIHIPVGREYVPNAFKRGLELYRFIKSHKIDIVQTFHQKADTYGALIAHFAGTRHIISSRRDTGELRRPWHHLLNRALRGLFENVIVVAEAVGGAIAASEGIDPARIVRIYNGVDVTKFAPPSAYDRARRRDTLGLDADDLVVGMVAGFRPEKNHAGFFQAVRAAIDLVPHLKVVAVGAGPLLEQFRTICAAPPLRSRVVFTGDVADVAPLLGVMDLGCLVPTANEGFSNAVLEKMATGLPLIVTNVGGNAEAVIHGENGLVIPPGDTRALVDALVAVSRDPLTRSAMGRRSRQLIEERFSLSKMCSEHEALYSALCERDP